MVSITGEFEEVMDQAITNGTTATQPLLQCLNNALAPIAQLYADRNINEKFTQISKNLAEWNNAMPTQLVVGAYNTLKNAYLEILLKFPEQKYKRTSIRNPRV